MEEELSGASKIAIVAFVTNTTKRSKRPGTSLMQKVRISSD